MRHIDLILTPTLPGQQQGIKPVLLRQRVTLGLMGVFSIKPQHRVTLIF